MTEDKNMKTCREKVKANNKIKNVRQWACRNFLLHRGQVSGSQSGIALVLVLIISVIALAIMAALVSMLVSGTQISGMQKRYRTVQEAGLGGADVTYLMIAARGDPSIPLTGFSIPAMDVGTGHTNCLTDKLNKATANWASACSNTVSINPTDAATYDMTFQIGAGQSYTVYSKIVDTVLGNSGGDEGLVKGGVVSSSGEITVLSVPYLYTLEVDTQSTSNPSERAKYSILYEY